TRDLEECLSVKTLQGDLPAAVLLPDEHRSHLAVEDVDLACGLEVRRPGRGLVEFAVLNADVDGAHFQTARTAFHLGRPEFPDRRPVGDDLEARGHDDGVFCVKARQRLYVTGTV